VFRSIRAAMCIVLLGTTFFFSKAYSQVAPLSGEALNLASNASNLLQTGNPSAALQLLQQAYSLAPSSWDVSYYIGVALEQTGKIEDAQAWYRKAYSLDPSRHLSLLGIARIFFLEKNYSQALPLFEQLSKEFPASESSYSSYVCLAQCYAELGRFDDFDDTMQKALRVKTNDPTGWRFAGQEADHCKQYPLAAKYYAEYLKRFPSAQDRQEIGKRLNEVTYENKVGKEMSVVQTGFQLNHDTEDLAAFVTFMDPQHKGVSDTAVSQVLLGLSQIPRFYRTQLENHGYKLLVAPTVLAAMPELAGKTPRGYGDGADWHSTNGLFDRDRKLIIIGERSHMAGDAGKDVVGPLDETAQHEFGHAYDDYLGGKYSARVPDDASTHYSHTRKFSQQYDKDAAAIPADLRPKFAYYLQSGNAGKEELFAQMWVLFFGHQPEPGSPRESFKVVFPDVLALLEDSRKFDPDYQKFAAYYDERLRQNTLTPRERVIDTLNQK
jgi:tetratricopeptide (TPR) repeat protein